MTSRPGRHAALRRGRHSMPGQVYLLTATTVERRRVFADFELARAAAMAFEDRATLRGSRLLAWVLMPDHAHWVMELGRGGCLADEVSRLKSISARRSNGVLGTRGAVWDRAFHDRSLRCDAEVVSAARYVVANPVRAGLAARAIDYPFWNSTFLS